MSVKQVSTYGAVIPGSDFIISLLRQGTISRGAKKRLKWFDHYRKTGNARKTCRYFGISPQTFYRWLLRREGIEISASTLGRVIKRLKERGVLKEPVNVTLAKLARKRKWKPRYATRKP